MSEAKKDSGAAPVKAEKLPTLELRESEIGKYSYFRFYDIFVNGEETNLWLGIADGKDIVIDGILMEGIRFKIGKYGYYQRARERKIKKAK